MPQLDVTTKSATSVWKSPDGQREIFEVTLEWEGKAVKAKTYSKDISTEGWSGTVESYEKQGRNGSETFVKQPQKEGGNYGGGASAGGYRGGSKPQSDPYTMYLSYAKDLVVALIAAGSKIDFEQAIALTVGGGSELYASRPDAPDKSEDKPAVPDTVEPVSDDPVDLSAIDTLFPGSEKVE